MVLVTGASGFLGRRLVQQLSAQRVPVRALYHSHPPGTALLSLPLVEWTRCDLLDVFAVEEVMNGVEYLYHCAGIVSFEPARTNEMLHFNPESTANLVTQALAQGIRKMVYISSVAALGRSGVGGKEINEEEEWGESRYNSAYGLSKYLAETEVWRGIGEGLNAVIVNPGIILGECELHDPPARLLKAAYAEFRFYTKGVTSWVDVADVVKACIALMNSQVASERFIISCGNFSYREIFTLLADAMGKKPPKYLASGLLTALAWRWSVLRGRLTGKTPTLTRETALNASSCSFYNNEKLPQFLPGYTYTPIGNAAERMARYFLNSVKK